MQAIINTILFNERFALLRSACFVKDKVILHRNSKGYLTSLRSRRFVSLLVCKQSSTAMPILVYIVYISLDLCEIYEVHVSYPLKYVTNTNSLKTNNIYSYYQCPLFFCHTISNHSFCLIYAIVLINL